MFLSFCSKSFQEHLTKLPPQETVQLLRGEKKGASSLLCEQLMFDADNVSFLLEH